MKVWKRTAALLLSAALLSTPAALAVNTSAAPTDAAIVAFNESAYKDVLSTLSASQKDRLFQRLLCNITTSYNSQQNYDVRSSSNEDILNCIQWMQIGTHFPLKDYGAVEPGCDYLHTMYFSKANFDRLTSELFGRTLTLNTVTSIPKDSDVKNAYKTYLYQGNVQLFMPQAGDVMNERAEPHHLYQLKGNLYCAAYTMYEWYLDESNKQENAGTYQAVVQRNGNNWTLLYLTKKNGTIDDAVLSALQGSYNQPSEWAKAEVTAAQSAGLGVGLAGDPGWQDQATRLQFAQVAVQMVEKATGKTLEAAPAGTFGDCSDAAVLKAYQAGIVNGTDAASFTPNGTLTRETLATMLWRALEYVRQNGGTIGMAPAGSLSAYSDAGKVSDWAREAVTALNANAIMQGTSSSTLAPKNPCTVEQSVILAYRTLQKFQ